MNYNSPHQNYPQPQQEIAVRITPEHPDSTPPGVVRLPDGTMITQGALGKKLKGTSFFWLTFWLGNLGVGRFYVGHIGMGLAYLFTLGFCFVGPIIDLFRTREIVRNANEQRGWGRVTR